MGDANVATLTPMYMRVIDPRATLLTMTAAEFIALPMVSDNLPNCSLCRPDRPATEIPMAYARVPAGEMYLGARLIHDCWRLLHVVLSE